MAVEVHTYRIDVQSPRTSILSIVFWISDKTICSKITSLSFFVVRFIVC